MNEAERLKSISRAASFSFAKKNIFTQNSSYYSVEKTI